MSMLISSLTKEVIPIIVSAQTSREVWTVLESTLASPLNTQILNLQYQLQSLEQNEKTVSQYLAHAKTLADYLAAASRPLPLVDFNVYVFKGLRPEFKDIVTTLSSRPEPVTYFEFHASLLTHEFIHGDSISNLQVSASSTDQPTPIANVTYRIDPNSNPSCGRSRSQGFCGRGR